MPKRIGPFRAMELLPIEERLVHAGPYQAHWYRLVSGWVRGLSVLDVGAGHGAGLDILREGGPQLLVGIDPLPVRDDVLSTPIEAFEDNAFDIVVACDVIEHVADDAAFLAQLLRVARDFVFLSTPNWNVSRCMNEFHAREYTPEELAALVAGHSADYWSSDAACQITKIERVEEAASCFGVRLRR